MSEVVKSIENVLPLCDTLYEKRKQLLDILKTHPNHTLKGNNYEFSAMIKRSVKPLTFKYINALASSFDGTPSEFCKFIQSKQKEQSVEKWRLVRKKLS